MTGFGAAITSGTLSQGSFDNDLGAALGGLGASQAVWFAPDAGDLAGQIFLIVDANGIAGYQEGEDYVFAVSGAPLADLSGHTGFFSNAKIVHPHRISAGTARSAGCRRPCRWRCARGR